MSALKEQFTLLRDFLCTSFRKTVLFCAIGFIAAGVIGYIVGLTHPETVESIIIAFLQNAEDNGVIQQDGSYSVLALLANNWSAMLIAVAYGFLPFIFAPVYSLALNGFILGISGALYHLNDWTLALWLAGLLPHGIFELTAFALSIACGVHLCISVNRIITKSIFRTPMTETLSDLLRVLLLAVAPLTIAAAFIEVYVTPWVMTFFM